MSPPTEPTETTPHGAGGNPPAGGTQRLPRAQRRDQLLAAATRAFARGGYQATSLDDVAAQAGITRMILYRHFDSKADLYLAVLDRVVHRLAAATGSPGFDETSIHGLLTAAADDPDGFRLVFRHATREPDFRAHVDRFRDDIFEVTYSQLAERIPDERWARWAATVVPAAVVEAVIAWLDVGQPDPTEAATRVRRLVHGIVDAARTADPAP